MTGRRGCSPKSFQRLGRRGSLSEAVRAGSRRCLCLEDVDAAIGRLFSALPQVDEIALRVIHTATGEPIMQGTVTRQDAGNTKAASVRMKLTFMGISHRLSGSHFEVPLESGVSGHKSHAS